MSLVYAHGNQRRHSYRELDRRQTAKNILFYLEDREDAKGIFNPEFKNFRNAKDEQRMRNDFAQAENLLANYKQGNANFHQYRGFSREIEAAIKKLIAGQTVLQF